MAVSPSANQVCAGSTWPFSTSPTGSLGRGAIMCMFMLFMDETMVFIMEDAGKNIYIIQLSNFLYIAKILSRLECLYTSTTRQ